MYLYEITSVQKELIAEIEAMDGELTPEMEQALEITKEHLERKSMAYLSIITTKDGFNTLIDGEIKRLQQLKKVNTNVVKRLKDNLLQAVKLFGDFEVGTHKFGTRKSETLEVEDVNLLPDKFKFIKVTESADKMALKQALKDGEIIDGVELKSHLHLKIK